MEIFPAIDIIGGTCVRLTRGDYKKKKKYFDDPLKVAFEWKDCGSKWLHVVDLDGAEFGRPKNLKIVQRIRSDTGLNIQYGGGLRDIKTIEDVLGKGIDRVILGTKLVEDEDFLEEVSSRFKGRFIPSIDYGVGGQVYVRGWKEGTDYYAGPLLEKMYKKGIGEAIITDISRDGTLTGVDIGSITKILEETSISLIIAGGISSISDIESLGILPGSRISGVILGKSLYEKKIDLRSAIRSGEKYDK